jgi:hypothetical protein
MYIIRQSNVRVKEVKEVKEDLNAIIQPNELLSRLAIS